jgi:NAD/NADP transhydrogenase beta subunit
LHTTQPGGWVGTILPILIIAGVFAYRMRSMSKERPLKTSTMWIVPAVLLAMAVALFWAAPPPAMGWALIAAGVAIGAGIGWYRGKMIAIRRDPETGALTQKASPLALLLIAGVVIIKIAGKQYMGATDAASPGSPAMIMTDAVLGFGIGLLTATRVEMYLRVRRILAGA